MIVWKWKNVSFFGGGKHIRIIWRKTLGKAELSNLLVIIQWPGERGGEKKWCSYFICKERCLTKTLVVFTTPPPECPLFTPSRRKHISLPLKKRMLSSAYYAHQQWKKKRGLFLHVLAPFFSTHLLKQTQREKSNVSLTEGNSIITECDTENPPPIYQKPVRGEGWILTNCHIANNVSDSEVINKSHSQAATNLYSGQAFRERGRERGGPIERLGCVCFSQMVSVVRGCYSNDRSNIWKAGCLSALSSDWTTCNPAHKRSHS